MSLSVSESAAHVNVHRRSALPKANLLDPLCSTSQSVQTQLPNEVTTERETAVKNRPAMHFKCFQTPRGSALLWLPDCANTTGTSNSLPGIFQPPMPVIQSFEPKVSAALAKEPTNTNPQQDQDSSCPPIPTISNRSAATAKANNDSRLPLFALQEAFCKQPTH
jgi:hypothetical protein